MTQMEPQDIQVIIADLIRSAEIKLRADIAADLRTCSLLAEVAGNDCRARAFETAAEIVETIQEDEP